MANAEMFDEEKHKLAHEIHQNYERASKGSIAAKLLIKSCELLKANPDNPPKPRRR